MNNKDERTIAELVCDLTRYCNIKEEYFSSAFNLSPTQVKLLKLFIHSDAITVKELCNQLKLSNGRITQIISALERKDILTRKPDKKDKRNTIVILKPKSKRYIKNIINNYEDLHKTILSTVNKKDRDNIIKSLKILNNILFNWIQTK